MDWWTPEGRDATLATLRRATLLEVDDAGTQQIIKRMRGLAAERPEDVYRAQPHGFTSHPPEGSEGLFLALSGRSDRMLGLGFEHKDHRPKSLPPGGAALYDANGKIIKLIKDENVWDAGGKPVTIRNATTIKIEATESVAIGVDGRWIRIRPGRVDLAVKTATEDAPYKVVTEAGPSEVVFARLD